VSLKFTNGFVFEIFMEYSDSSEGWRFFDMVDKKKNHLVICGNGIETYDDEGEGR
jgi:hypothetical protein